MTSNSDGTVCNPLAVKLKIINHDPRNCNNAVVAAVGPAAVNASDETDGQNREPKQHKMKRKRGYKHDENAT
eukprot:scaffold32287_cov172-Skeletonema_dohrnii-CCMP3373.AAC.1